MILKSRNQVATIELAAISSIFNLVQAGPAVAPATECLRWNGAAWGISAGTNNFTLIAWIKYKSDAGVATSLGCYSGVPFYSIFESSAAYNDSYGRKRLITHAVAGGIIHTGTYQLTTRPQGDGWNMIVMQQQNGVSYSSFVDGMHQSVVMAPAQAAGIDRMGLPLNIITTGASAGNPDFDNGVGATGWPGIKFAMMMGFSRVLSQQELLDLYAMTMLGKGYGISRLGLEVFWLGRRDSTVAGDITALPQYPAYYTPRAAPGAGAFYGTIIPDLSGHARHGNLYTQKTTWADVLDTGGTDLPPSMYYPTRWIDNSLVYDGANDYTKRTLQVDYSGSSFS